MMTVRQFAFRLTMAAMVAGVLPLSGAQAASLYKWVDEQGNVHYSDKLPPDQVRNERAVLDKRGITVDTVEAPRPPEEIAEEQRQAEEEARRQAEQAAEAAKQAERDRVLLYTFLSVEDMERVRDNRIRGLESAVQLGENRINRLQAQLDMLRGEAAQMEKRGQPIPDTLRESLGETKRQIAHNREFVETKRRERELVSQQFERDIRRFTELKSSGR